MGRNKNSVNPLKIIFWFLLLTVVATTASAILWWQGVQKPIDPQDDTQVRFLIPKGYGAQAIGDKLQEEGFIKSSLAFRLIVKRDALGNKLQAGSYSLSKSLTLSEIAQSFQRGSEDEFWVTIPEGKRREEIAKILADTFAEHGASFSLPDFLEATEEIEGYLFPDTYLFPKTTTTEDVVQTLRNTFDTKVPDTLKVQASAHGLDFHEVLILASLIEREAKLPVDRPKVSGVLYNRLSIDMPLQIDATVQYAFGTAKCQSSTGSDCNWWPVLTDTKYQSPFNTYINPGLPPSPIANPGLASIEAALAPQEHDYLYYLSEDSGTTHYARTYSQHQDNIEKYLR
jgi:UPF0755 protein